MGLVLIGGARDASAWTMKKGPLMTKWSMVGDVAQIDPNHVWEAYPRMQMKRLDSWQNLNGIWQFQTLSSGTGVPPSGKLSGEILVPFPPQSAISGVMTSTASNTYCLYRRVLSIPDSWAGKRILLHFGSVDYKAEVFLNKSIVAQHVGGYDAFTVNLSKYKVKNGDTLSVRVWDPTNGNGGYNPVGKQTLNAGGIFYTATTGIWKNVWLEAVPASVFISNLKITPDVDNQSVQVTVTLEGDSLSKLSGYKVYAFAKNKDRGMWGADSLAATASTKLTVKLSAVNLWWPDRPFLYDLGIYLKKDGVFKDSVQSYFGMRKVNWKSIDNKRRIMLNDQSVFAYGTLDQGYWPDGIYTPPSEEAMRYDLEMHKEYGMNMVRKHVKVEADYWFWLCDSMGLLVEQDMVSLHTAPTADGQTNFRRELDSLIIQNYNHPSIFMWITFNEGWGIPGSGQTYVQAAVNRVKELDVTRIINAHTGIGFGWYPYGDVKCNHNYPPPGRENPDPNWIMHDGEFGGIRMNTVAMDAHEWKPNESWGYSDQTNEAGYESVFDGYCQSLAQYKNEIGLCGGVYTQITDVETECNGLLTYDRAIAKGRTDKIKASCDRIVDHPPVAAVVNPTAQIDADFFKNATGVINTVQNKPTALRIAGVQTTGKLVAVSLSGAEKGVSRLSIVNVKGQNVFSTTVSNARTVNVPADRIVRGVYIARLENGNATQQMQFLVK
jgi:beta-galactosidase/beta-glucuronidase